MLHNASSLAQCTWCLLWHTCLLHKFDSSITHIICKVKGAGNFAYTRPLWLWVEGLGLSRVVSTPTHEWCVCWLAIWARDTRRKRGPPHYDPYICVILTCFMYKRHGRPPFHPPCAGGHMRGCQDSIVIGSMSLSKYHFWCWKPFYHKQHRNGIPQHAFLTFIS